MFSRPNSFVPLPEYSLGQFGMGAVPPVNSGR
jgi:hypothetical protein